jgi:hypothetical protein
MGRKLSTGTWILVFVMGLTSSLPARAATAPSLGNADNFSVLAALSMSAAGAGTTISGDLGLSPGLAVSRTGSWTVGGSEYFGTGGRSANAQTDALAAFNNLAGQTSDGGWGTNPWSPVPGTWTVAADTTFTGTITLDGDYSDVWVFQVGNDMIFDGSIVLAGNVQPCNVFWQIGRDATIAAGSTFAGTLIASRDITLVSGATVDGRLISLNSSLTTDGNAISGPTCDVAPADDHSDIKVKKTASDYKLNSGPKKVTFTYKVTNEGDVALSDVSLKDNKCDDEDFISGDDNGNDLLDIDEEWKYTCKKTVKETETNTATAKGTANGEEVKDTDKVTVTVSTPGLPNAGFSSDDQTSNLWNTILSFFSF